MVLELRMIGAAGMRERPLKCSVWEMKPQERVWTKGTWCDKNDMC